MSCVRIVLANGSLAAYPQGGGHWTCFLQYLLGLQALGYDLFWLEILQSSGDKVRDERMIRIFRERFQRYGFGERCAVLLFEDADEQRLEAASAIGKEKNAIQEIARDADVLWNFACTVRQPLLSLFQRRALIDLDPGILQVSALSWDMGIHDHHTFFTVGSKLGDADCEVPDLGVLWRPVRPIVFLPMWEAAPDPGADAPFSSVTQWTWEELWLGQRVLKASKRDGYLRYLDFPRRTGRLVELAVNIDPQDETGDRELLLSHGWRLVHPHQVASSPAAYQRYLRRSRAEFQCPKPIYRELRTGWFSDRSCFYLASGRPVLAEDTGFSDHYPAGRGLVAFRDLEEAAAAAADIDADFAAHARAARGLVEELLDSRRALQAMLDACASSEKRPPVVGAQCGRGSGKTT
jgi:hypothetical protein